MEENKGCSHGDCEKCKDQKMCCGGHVCEGHKCCGRCHHAMKIIGALVLLALAFCLGTFVGSHSLRGYGERGNFKPMINYGYGPKTNFNGDSGSVTVKVLPTAGVGTTTPQVKQ